MQQLAREASRYRVDSWLKDVVAGVLRSSRTLRIDRQELWDFLDQLPVAILISTDRACTNIVGNKAAQMILQVPHGGNLSQSAPPKELPPFKVFSDGREMDPDDLPMQRAARTGERVGRSECEIRFVDHESIFIAGHTIPIHDEGGDVCGSLGAFVDVTQQRLQLDQADLMACEMVHRVKNTVSLVQALAHNTIRSLIEPAEYRKFEGRLLSISSAQDLIARSFVEVDLAALISSAVGPVVQARLDDISFEGPAITVMGDHAMSLSMIFHELATNASKYGALRNDSGTVALRWGLDPELQQILSIEWTETGGPNLGKPDRSGFGTKLIDRLVRSLPCGKIRRKYADEGLIARIDFQTLPARHDGRSQLR